MPHATGRHFLQIPGPTNVPERILRAIARPTIDHRGPECAALGRRVLVEIRKIFKTDAPVIIYPSSGTGAWEAALVNTLSPGDKVLMCETGQFAVLWRQLATRFGLHAIQAVTDGDFGIMVALHGTEIIRVPLSEGTKELKVVRPDLYDEVEILFG